MATGDIQDMAGRIRSVLPARWFPLTAPGAASATPVLDGLLAGLAWVWSWLYSLIAYANLQTRIATATDVWLDLTSLDFFGLGLQRATNEGDPAYRARIKATILQPKATRAALSQALVTLTGRAPFIFEPANPSDAGGYSLGGVGYGAAGGYGNLSLPYQAFVTAYRPAGGGIATVAPYTGLAGASNLTLLSNGDSTLVVSTAQVAPLPGQVVRKCTVTASGNKVAGFYPASVVNGNPYDASLWLWIPSGSTFTSISFHGETGAVNDVDTVLANLSATNCWQRVVGTFTATATSANVVLRTSSSGAGASLYVAMLRIDPAGQALGSPGGYGVGALEYITPAMISGQITDAMIQSTVTSEIPAASIAWLRITN